MSEIIEKPVESHEKPVLGEDLHRDHKAGGYENDNDQRLEAPKAKPKRIISEAAKQKGIENLAKGRELLKLKKQQEKEERELFAKELKKRELMKRSKELKYKVSPEESEEDESSEEEEIIVRRVKSTPSKARVVKEVPPVAVIKEIRKPNIIFY